MPEMPHAQETSDVFLLPLRTSGVAGLSRDRKARAQGIDPAARGAAGLLVMTDNTRRCRKGVGNRIDVSGIYRGRGVVVVETNMYLARLGRGTMRPEMLLGDADAMRDPARCTVLVACWSGKGKMSPRIGSRHEEVILRSARSQALSTFRSSEQPRQVNGSCTCIWEVKKDCSCTAAALAISLQVG